MPPVVVQLEGVKTSLEVIPDGKYPAKLTKHTFGVSKEKKPKVDCEFIFDSDGGDDNPAAGRKAFVGFSLQPQALFKIKRALIDMGMEPEELEGPVDIDAALSTLAGAEAMIRVTHHEWEGSTRNDFNVASPDSWTSDG